METYPAASTGETDEYNDSAELIIPLCMTSWLESKHFLSPDQQLSFKTTSTGTRRIVTQRDDDLLTPAEVRDRWPEVEAAML